jgi:hypothetical protein
MLLRLRPGVLAERVQPGAAPVQLGARTSLDRLDRERKPLRRDRGQRVDRVAARLAAPVVARARRGTPRAVSAESAGSARFAFPRRLLVQSRPNEGSAVSEWPIGQARDGLIFRVNPDGAVFANGTRVTDAYGWIDVGTLASARARGAPTFVSVRLGVRVTLQGRYLLHAGEVRVEGRGCAGVEALDTAWADFWVASLETAVRVEIDRRVDPGRALPRRPSSVPTVAAEATPASSPPPMLPRRTTAPRSDPPRRTTPPPPRSTALASSDARERDAEKTAPDSDRSTPLR